MMKREGSVRTLEIIKECAETAGGYKISLEQAERAMETEQLERIADALEGISGHLSRLTSCIGITTSELVKVLRVKSALRHRCSVQINEVIQWHGCREGERNLDSSG